MTTPLYRPIPKNMPGAKAPLASDVTQIIDLFNGNLDAGTINLAQQISSPSTTGITATAATGTTLGIGQYIYKFTYVTGLIQADGTVTVGGETPGSSSLTVTTTSSNQNVTINGLPGVASWSSTAIGIRIYRTAVGGADGTQKLVTSIYTNYARNSSQTTYTDSTADASLGVAVPTVNTTGTTLNTSYMSSDNSSWKIKDKNAVNAFQVWLDGTKKVATANNTLDDGSGNMVSRTLSTSVGSVNGGQPHVTMQNNGSQRFNIGLTGVESAGNAGADFNIWGYDNTGAYLGQYFHITRASGLVQTLHNTLDDGNGNVTVTGNLIVGSNTINPMVKIADIKLTATQASVDFTNIPQTYSKLILCHSAQTDYTGGSNGQVKAQFNGKSVANYSWAYSYNTWSSNGTNTAINNGSWYGQTATAIGFCSTNNHSGLYYYAQQETTFFDYANTSKYPQFSTTGFYSDGDHYSYVTRHGGQLSDTTQAITSIHLFPDNGNFLAGSRFTLYGVV